MASTYSVVHISIPPRFLLEIRVIASSKWDLKISGEQYMRWCTRIFGIGFLIYNFGLVRLVYGVLGLVSYHGPIILGTIC